MSVRVSAKFEKKKKKKKKKKAAARESSLQNWKRRRKKERKKERSARKYLHELFQSDGIGAVVVIVRTAHDDPDQTS